MEETTQTTNAAPASTTTQSSNANVFDEKSGAGPIIGIIIVVVLLLIGGVYYYMSMQSETVLTPGQEQSGADTAGDIAAAPDAATEALKVQSNSTNVADIEADLNATDLNGLSSDLPAIEAGAAQ